ncbi:MAG: dihydrofolate reductase [Devosia nanyangense]|uniref:Dihydrofolate reductase n=1 Tax=Devosia nanyangense TaxID=1228055 RepID=A0A933NZK6_9HYPH|nr:dihydrofolate reductase [Devosia nanyangense]
MNLPVAIIAAVAENGVIGNGNAIPWRLPSDFAHFKRMTLGKPVIMGRKTFESIGRPLPGRTNIVVTRQEGYQPEGVLVISSLEAALEHAQAIAAADHAEEVMVAGGAEIYARAMPLADRLYITHVALAPAGDTHFPQITAWDWEDVGGVDVAPNPRDNAAFRVRVYRRRSKA